MIIRAGYLKPNNKIVLIDNASLSCYFVVIIVKILVIIIIIVVMRKCEFYMTRAAAVLEPRRCQYPGSGLRRKNLFYSTCAKRLVINPIIKRPYVTVNSL